MNTTKDLEKALKDEFGIHFKNSPDELQFLIAFIQEREALAREDGYQKAVGEITCGFPYHDEARKQERHRVLEELRELTWYRNDDGVKELDDGVPYLKVSEVESLITKKLE